MGRDYEDIRATDDLNDNELRALVRDSFEQQLAFDPDDVQVSVRSGVVNLSGRVGTPDLVGIKNLQSGLVVDPIRRAESPEAIDEHVVDEQLHEGLLLGDQPRPDDPEAEHLRENLRAELFGTTDVRQSIEGAIPWNPPDGPTPEGITGSEDTPDESRDDI